MAERSKSALAVPDETNSDREITPRLRRADQRHCATRCRPAIAVLACVIVIVGVAALAAPGDLLWQNQVNFGGDDGTWAVAAAHGRVVVVGQSDTSPDNVDLLVRAYDGDTGAVLWQDRFDYAGGLDVAQSVVADEHVVVIGGSAESTPGTCGSVGFCGGFVRAYDIGSGTPLWQDVFPAGPAGSVEALTLDGPRVVATGYGGTNCDLSFADCDQITRGYDVRTGALLWEDRVDDASSTSVAATANTIVVGSATLLPEFLVRAHDAISGELLWEDRAGAPVPVNVAHQIAAHGGRVFAVGYVNRDWLVRAYHARSGELLWQQTFDFAGAGDVAWQVATDGQSVAVGGMARQLPPAPGARDWAVRTYDAKTGELLWSDVLDVGSFDEVVGGVTMHQNQVFAYGVVRDSTTRNDMFIRAYDVRSGQVLWQDQVDVSGSFDNPGGFYYRALAEDGGRVTLAGWGFVRRLDGTADYDWVVRTYDASKPH